MEEPSQDKINIMLIEMLKTMRTVHSIKFRAQVSSLVYIFCIAADVWFDSLIDIQQCLIPPSILTGKLSTSSPHVENFHAKRTRPVEASFVGIVSVKFPAVTD